MRAAIVADTHLGNHTYLGGALVSGLNIRCRAALAVLHDAAEYAGMSACDVFIVAGDLFDSPRTAPQLIHAAADAMKPMAQDGRRVYLLRGNHDAAGPTELDDALAPFRHIPGFTVVSGEAQRVTHLGASFALIPYAPSSTAVLAGLRDTVAGTEFVVAHAGLVDSRTPKYLSQGADAVNSGLIKSVLVGMLGGFFGHWHSWKQFEGDNVWQIGTLIPHDFNDVGDTGRMAIVDTGKGTVEWVHVSGPRFVNLANGALIECEDDCEYYIRASVDDTRDIDNLMPASVTDAHVQRVESDSIEATVAARACAQAARAASTLDDALIAYVAEMPLDASVSRENVRAHCARYLSEVQ